MTEEEVTDLIIISKAYSLELTRLMLDAQKSGCRADDISSQVMRLIVLKEQLLYKIKTDDYGTETQKLYSCLLQAVAGYSGAAISLDPHASIPNTALDITIIGDERPSWFDFSYADMETADQDADGGRYTYINPVLAGWEPSLETPTTFFRMGVDFDVYEGGRIVFRSGYGLYDGQSVRADNFRRYTAPPITPPFGTNIWDDNELWNDNQPWID